MSGPLHGILVRPLLGLGPRFCGRTERFNCASIWSRKQHHQGRPVLVSLRMRATRSLPPVAPATQTTFYDPGGGNSADNRVSDRHQWAAALDQRYVRHVRPILLNRITFHIPDRRPHVRVIQGAGVKRPRHTSGKGGAAVEIHGITVCVSVARAQGMLVLRDSHR